MLDKRLAFAIKTVGVSWLCVYDFPVNIHGIVVLEWRVTSQHFVKKNANSPPINSLSVTLIQQDLRGNILWSTANCVSSLSDNFGETEINHLQEPISTNHNVLWLQIPVDNIKTLKIFKDGYDLSSVEGSLLWVEVSNASVIGEQISSLEKFSHKIDVLIVLHESVIFHL